MSFELDEFYSNAAVLLEYSLLKGKFQRLLENQCKIENEGRAQAMEATLSVKEFEDRLTCENMQILSEAAPESDLFADKLEFFKRRLTDDTWNDIKNNPKLPEMVETHANDAKLLALRQVINFMMDTLEEANQLEKEPMTKDELYQIFGVENELRTSP